MNNHDVLPPHLVRKHEMRVATQDERAFDKMHPRRVLGYYSIFFLYFANYYCVKTWLAITNTSTRDNG